MNDNLMARRVKGVLGPGRPGIYTYFWPRYLYLHLTKKKPALHEICRFGYASVSASKLCFSSFGPCSSTGDDREKEEAPEKYRVG